MSEGPQLPNLAAMGIGMGGGNGPIANKPGFILTPFGPISMNVEVGGGFKLETVGIGNKPILQVGRQGNGLADKFFQAIQAIPDSLRQGAQQAGVMYAGALPEGHLPGRANVAPMGGQEIQMG